ncbi:hypothetical protein KHM83_14230 [Fusibacter paucivorans]|uniref:Uncharacterized protein n=1 Tax=Fusibacter paucivorans TaxID=76009 RepID=A0ABS5PRY1_9FIRM|nr:hypothetical protein [Fusibacter paucivorans]MBS7527838.1 hypothetical protein [Fusibacter paucivorans]
MKYVKVKNYIMNNGTCDYKGLNIEKFVGGGQLYRRNHVDCVIATYEDTIPSHSELEEVSEELYNSTKSEIDLENRDVKSSDEKVIDIEKKIIQSETEKIDIFEALAEIYEMMV